MAIQSIGSAEQCTSPQALRRARDQMRAQISALEVKLSHVDLDCSRALLCRHKDGRSNPRIASLGELERQRDELIGTLARAEDITERIEAERASARLRLQAMLADPKSFKFVRIRNAEMGLPSCKTYEVIPRLGPIGMLAGWWQVKVSSGCP